jgi:hypothetical protein
MLGAFLQQTDLSDSSNRWYHLSLRYACEWLQNNNPYLIAYHSLASRLLEQSERSSINLPAMWPQAMHIPEDDSEIVMPPYVLPDEIHNEDTHYSRLATGFLLNNDEQQLPLSFADAELEPLLFPDLFPDDRGHYGDLHNQPLANNNALTYGKYIKARPIGYDARFRLHPVWIMWSYMQLVRNFQNTARLRRQRSVDTMS